MWSLFHPSELKINRYDRLTRPSNWIMITSLSSRPGWCQFRNDFFDFAVQNSEHRFSISFHDWFTCCKKRCRAEKPRNPSFRSAHLYDSSVKIDKVVPYFANAVYGEVADYSSKIRRSLRQHWGHVLGMTEWLELEWFHTISLQVLVWPN